jgi:hypothetical protein
MKGKEKRQRTREQAELNLPTKRNRPAGPRRHYSDISGNIKRILFLSTELQGMEMTLYGFHIKVSNILMQFSYRKLKGADIGGQWRTNFIFSLK